MPSPGVQVLIEPSGSAPIAGVGTSTAALLLKVLATDASGKLVAKPTLVTSYEGFVREFLVPPAPPPAPPPPPAPQPPPPPPWPSVELKRAAEVVYGFFLNGGTRCYVMGYAPPTNTLQAAWDKIAKIDEIALVVAPGAEAAEQTDLAGKCAALGDRFAIVDGPPGTRRAFVAAGVAGDQNTVVLPSRSDYVAYYYPWINIISPFDGLPATVPPAGHVAGVYARVDETRGVHKAPANEEIRGALGVSVLLSDDHQSKMNDLGANAIRVMQGSVRVWGARTLGGVDNGETMHINVRRTLLFLKESIDKGLQWVVFEPNTPALWGKVRRNIGAFLHDVWASGALFGNTAEEAYYVACNEELNPPSMRDNGQLNVEVGVALVRPAEFVTIRIRQWSGPNR